MKALMLTIVACLAIAIAGCGDDDDTTSATTETTAAETTESTTGDTNQSSEAKKPAEKKSASSGEGTQPGSIDKKPVVKVPGGAPPKKLEKNDLIEGDGAEAAAGDEVTVQYVGVGYDSEEQFDASWDRGEPFAFKLGSNMVIPGWEEGVPGMKVGGRRELVIPPALAYGPAGSPPSIGPNETLIFVVDLVAVN